LGRRGRVPGGAQDTEQPCGPKAQDRNATQHRASALRKNGTVEQRPSEVTCGSGIGREQGMLLNLRREHMHLSATSASVRLLMMGSSIQIGGFDVRPKRMDAAIRPLFDIGRSSYR
jgi:hypothetical protein